MTYVLSDAQIARGGVLLDMTGVPNASFAITFKTACHFRFQLPVSVSVSSAGVQDTTVLNYLSDRAAEDEANGLWCIC